MQTNPFEYYQSEELHGNYQYVPLSEVVNFFMQNYTGDTTVLGLVKRFEVVSWAKKGIQQLNFNALREVKAIELDLGENLDIILPPDYVNYARISWLDEQTGQFHPMSENTRLSIVSAYLQDWRARILFDNNGFILEGTSATEIVNNRVSENNTFFSYTCADGYYNECNYGGKQIWKLDTGRNYNGEFTINNKRIHFGSNMADRRIILEYVSDGIALADSEIYINKLAEMALYMWIRTNLLSNRQGISLSEKQIAKRDWDTAFRNAKVATLGIKIAELTQRLKAQNMWFK